MEYNFREIERRWQKRWSEEKTFKAENHSEKPKFYVLDMFPYPSGAGLHVGHLLGYIASDIYARYMRHRGYNVLHPMGYDSFGLPAEQYAIQTGQHPAVTTEQNIARYREQLDRIGFSFDWDREVRTSEPSYYKWTQWIFKRLFTHWYNTDVDHARPIEELKALFEQGGSVGIKAQKEEHDPFTAEEWKGFTEYQQEYILQHYRLAFLADSWVNWCPALGTVLANDEVKDGLSERGGHPVVQKRMRQWSLRITAYAQRLLDGLDHIDWPDALKEQQRNWLGRSEGARVFFEVEGHDEKIEVFTTRPDTLFGASFIVLAPEHELVNKIASSEYKEEVDQYVLEAGRKSERDRQADTKSISGKFTGAYAVHPFTGECLPIWIADYVLAGYGVGAIMAVPAGDQRDWDFAKHFGIDIPNIFEGVDLSEGAMDSKEAILSNSSFLDGLSAVDAIGRMIKELESMGIGEGKVNFRLRDAIFSRQRYWGEPFPVFFEGELPRLLEDKELPLGLPQVDKYLPTEDGEPPLARTEQGAWPILKGDRMEYNTMPGWAGSSWYFLRYMDLDNTEQLVGSEAEKYWRSVDLYIGGSEHATGHLLYARFWQKFLFDLDLVSEEEPFRKLINQGMILGTSTIVYRINGTNTFVSKGLKNEHETTALHADVNMVDGDVLDIEAFKNWRPEYHDAEFILEDGKYHVGAEVEKMSKRWYNVVNPDDICNDYGADTLRMYEMFLGPLEQSKPWNTAGISGVHNFLRKFWRLYHNQDGFFVSDEKATEKELKVLHTAIKKVNSDIEDYSFNTSVSAFMICVNELQDLKCTKREILEPLCCLLSPFAPHIAEEIWSEMSADTSISTALWPVHNEDYLVEASKEYPVMFNGKLRFKHEFALSMSQQDITSIIQSDERTTKYLDGKQAKKIIVVPGKIINVVF